MPYCLDQINQAVRQDPAAFMAAGDAAFHEKVCRAADLIQSHRDKSPVVLLSGPSGSGKTTTAGMINAELERRGIHTHTISMDDYFLTPDPSTAPRTPDGEMDFESPLMLDLALLDDHFSRLARGEEILVPHFEFARRMRNDSKGTTLRLGPDEVAIFEGIHALNTTITGKHPEATRLYISARSDVVDGEGKVCFKGTWMRLTRRAVRDYNFRGTDVKGTLDMWANVRRGEKLYISPYKQTAHMLFDSSLPYEVSVMACYARPLLFEPIDPATVPAASLLHEFIG